MNTINQLAEYLRYFVDCHRSEVAPVRLSIYGTREALSNTNQLDHPVSVSVAQYLSHHLTHRQPTIGMLETAVEVLIKHYRGGSDIELELCELLGHLEYGHNVSFNPIPYGFDEHVEEVEVRKPR